MEYPFVKMHGAGNDYIYMDGCRGNPIPGDPAAASVAISRRRFSVGSDGLILILPDPEADARMSMFNADGSEGKMCGNGIRCVAKYLWDFGICKKETMTIATKSGLKTLRLNINPAGLVESVTVDMGTPEFSPEKIPVITQNNCSNEIKIDITPYGELNASCVSMGNPHAVCFTENVDALELDKIGPICEKNPAFPESVNTEFVEVIDAHNLKFRVWERGSGETLACGTGICAAAVIACEKGYCKRGEKINVFARGGRLEINYRNDGRVEMTGPAEISYMGTVEYDG